MEITIEDEEDDEDENDFQLRIFWAK